MLIFFIRMLISSFKFIDIDYQHKTYYIFDFTFILTRNNYIMKQLCIYNVLLI